MFISVIGFGVNLGIGQLEKQISIVWYYMLPNNVLRLRFSKRQSPSLSHEPPITIAATCKTIANH